MQPRQPIQQRHAQFPHRDHQQLPRVLAVDNSDNGHDDAKQNPESTQHEVEFRIIDFMKRPKGFPAVPETHKRIVGEDVGYESKGAIGEIVTVELLNGEIVLERRVGSTSDRQLKSEG